MKHSKSSSTVAGGSSWSATVVGGDFSAEPVSRTRRLIGYGAEAVVSLGLALGFFAVFLALLNVFFPTGIQLRGLVVPVQQRSEPAPAAATGEIARLSVLRSEVRSKPAGAIAWGAASSRLALHDRDAIQTLSKGRGLVTFEDGDQVHLERNSLMIVMAKVVESEGAAPGAGVAVVDGEVWGKLRLDPDEKMRVRLPGGDLQLAAGSQDGAEFRVAVTKNKSSTVALYRGQASVSAQGKTVALSANQGTRLSAAGELGGALDLPAAPRPLAPGDGTELRYADFPPQILFQWTPVPNADRYRIVVARDRQLKDVVIDETVGRADLLCPGLSSGGYVWRVSSLRGDIEGQASPWRTVRTSLFGGPPKLQVDELPKVLEEGSCEVRGRTLPGSRVMISGESVPVAADGTFKHTLTLAPGANVVTVEAIDAEGNASYWTRVVHVKS